MEIKKSVPKAGLDGFKSWLQEQFPGHRLSVSHSREGEEYLCTLKFIGVVLAQAKAATQKLSAEKAAADAHKLCNGDPFKLRGILRLRGPARGGQLVEVTEDAEAEELPPSEPPKKAEASEDKKTRKLVVDLAKQLEQAQSLIQSQARDIKRLKREVADLQNLNLNSKMETATHELHRMKSALKEIESKAGVEPSVALKATVEALEQRLRDLESTGNSGLRKEAKSLSLLGSERTYRDFKEALLEWAPDYAEMTLPIVAALLAFRLTALPRLSILRAFHQVLGDDAHLAVVSAEPSWAATSQAMTPEVLREFQKALDHPHRLHLVVFDGLNRAGLNTWARGICNWAAELTSPLEFQQQNWPCNLRVCFVPSHTCLVGILNQKIAAIPPTPEKECGFFPRVGTQCFVGQGLTKVRCQRERLMACLKLLGHAHLVDDWENKLLRLWPAMYQSETWWAPLEMDGSR